MNIDTLRIAVFLIAIQSSADKRGCISFGKFLLRRFLHFNLIACSKLVICLP